MVPLGLLLHLLITAGGLPPERYQHVNVRPDRLAMMRQDTAWAVRFTNQITECWYDSYASAIFINTPLRGTAPAD